MMLAPVRTHRDWFWPHYANQIAWLKPVKFVGFPSAFPAPLAMFYWGWKAERFYEAFKDRSTRIDDI